MKKPHKSLTGEKTLYHVEVPISWTHQDYDWVRVNIHAHTQDEAIQILKRRIAQGMYDDEIKQRDLPADAHFDIENDHEIEIYEDDS